MPGVNPFRRGSYPASTGSARRSNRERHIVMLMALYMHLGPFSKNVIGEIDRRIAQLDEANRGSAAEVVMAGFYVSTA